MRVRTRETKKMAHTKHVSRCATIACCIVFVGGFTLSKMPNYFEGGKRKPVFLLPCFVIPHDGQTLFTPNRPQSLVPSNFKRTKKLTLRQ